MQLILDNIVATVVAASVALMLVTAQHNNSLSVVESTVFFMLEQQMMDFQSLVRRDMQNVRSVETVSETDSSFVFWAQTSPIDTTRKRISYTRNTVGQRHTEAGPINLYQITRYENGAPTGGSIGTITEWAIKSMNEEGNDIVFPADAAQISVSITAVLPIQTEQLNGITINESRWDATYHPRLLRETTL